MSMMNDDRRAGDVPRVADRPQDDTWRPLRVMLAWCGGTSAVAVVGVLIWLWATDAVLHLHFVLALAGGITGSLMLAGVLMGLVFVSSRSGHDASVADHQGKRSRD